MTTFNSCRRVTPCKDLQGGSEVQVELKLLIHLSEDVVSSADELDFDQEAFLIFCPPHLYPRGQTWCINWKLTCLSNRQTDRQTGERPPSQSFFRVQSVASLHALQRHSQFQCESMSVCVHLVILHLRS